MSSNFREDQYSRLLKFAGDKGDATIYGHLLTGRLSADPIELIMEKIIYALQKDKAEYFKMATDAIHNLNTPKDFNP